MSRTNVIYLTTHCNLNCSYCYEKANREAPGFKHKIVTSAEIDAFVDEVCTREKDTSPCVVIFGGEPLLEPDKLNELVTKFINRKSDTGVGFDLITNATLVDDKMAKMLKDLQDVLYRNNSSLKIEVSYDVSGQGYRVYPNGKSSNEATLKGLGMLHKYGVKYAISYVVSPLNYKNVLKDTLYCIMVLKADTVSLKWANTTLEEAGIDPVDLRKNLRPGLLEIYRRFQVPICEIACGACKKCDKSKEGNNYYVPDKGFIKSPTYVENSFNHFE